MARIHKVGKKLTITELCLATVSFESNDNISIFNEKDDKMSMFIVSSSSKIQLVICVFYTIRKENVIQNDIMHPNFLKFLKKAN